MVMLPCVFLAMYDKNVHPMEVTLRHFETARFKRPQIRKYKTENTFHKATIKKSSALLTGDTKNKQKEAAHVKTSKKRITA